MSCQGGDLQLSQISNVRSVKLWFQTFPISLPSHLYPFHPRPVVSTSWNVKISALHRNDWCEFLFTTGFWENRCLCFMFYRLWCQKMTKCMILYYIKRKALCGRSKTKDLFLEWLIQRVPCQSQAQAISWSQTVLFVCWICFGTCWPLIDMGARAGKTFLRYEANNSSSVTLFQMFCLRGCTDIIVVQKSEHFLFMFLFSLILCLSLTHSSCFETMPLVKKKILCIVLNLITGCDFSSQFDPLSSLVLDVHNLCSQPAMDERQLQPNYHQSFSWLIQDKQESE